MYEAIGGEAMLAERIREFHRLLRENLIRVVSRGQTDGSINPTIDPDPPGRAIPAGMRIPEPPRSSDLCPPTTLSVPGPVC